MLHELFQIRSADLVCRQDIVGRDAAQVEAVGQGDVPLIELSGIPFVIVVVDQQRYVGTGGVAHGVRYKVAGLQHGEILGRFSDDGGLHRFVQIAGCEVVGRLYDFLHGHVAAHPFECGFEIGRHTDSVGEVNGACVKAVLHVPELGSNVLLVRFDVAYAAEALEQDGLPLVRAQEVQRVKQDALLLRVFHGLLGGHHVHAQRHLHPSLVGRVGRKPYEVDLATGFFLLVQTVHRQIAGDHRNLSGIHGLTVLGKARREIAFHHDPSIVQLLERLVVRFKQSFAGSLFVDHVIVPGALFRRAEHFSAGQTQTNVLHGIFQARDEGTDAFGCDGIAKVVELIKGCRDFPAVLLEKRFVVENAFDGAVDGQLPQSSVNAQLFKRRKVVAAREPFRGQIVRVFARPHAHAAENHIG